MQLELIGAMILFRCTASESPHPGHADEDSIPEAAKPVCAAMHTAACLAALLQDAPTPVAAVALAGMVADWFAVLCRNSRLIVNADVRSVSNSSICLCIQNQLDVFQ